MTETKTSMLNNPVKIIGAALALGLIAGVAILYVKGQGSGNQAAALETSACTLDEARNASLNSAFKGDVAAMLAADTPQSLSPLAFNGPDGEDKTLKDFAGKTVLLNLWATWCVPCREEMPALNALQAGSGSDKFEVVAINVDTGTDEKPRRFLEETKVDKLAFYHDPDLGVFNDLKKRGLVLGLPVTLLVGPDGCLMAGMNGPANWGGADAKSLVEATLKLAGS
jgi:thiol-disulfide isomerase/thioredoxin